MDKLKLIQKIMPEKAEILVRTNGKDEYFVHYMEGINGAVTSENSVYRTYTNDLDTALDKVIEIIQKS